jgi:membrane-associated phospholipid phosphatase
MTEPTDEKPIEAVKETLQEAAKEETAAPRIRRYRTALFQLGLFGALVLFALLTFTIKTTPFFPIDVQITRAIQSLDSPLFAGFMTLISWAGFSPNSMIVTVIIAIVLYLYGLHWESVTALVASLSSGLANQLIKNFIQRPRPSVDLVNVFDVLDSYSFPSGHVMFYTIVFGYLWYLVYTLLKPSILRTFLLGFFGSLILLVGISRIYLGQHWASDVLGAYLLGSVMLVAVVLFHQWGKPRFFVRQPVAPPTATKNTS